MAGMTLGAERPENEESDHGTVTQSASSAEFVRQFGLWQDRANHAPVFVTHHGRPRHVLVSLTAYQGMLAAASGAASADAPASVLLATLVHGIDCAFVALDRGMAVTAMNPAASIFFKRSAQQTVGALAADTIPEFERTILAAHVARTIASGEASNFDMPSVSRPSEWLRCAVFPYGDGLGCLLRVVTGERQARLASATSIAMRQALAALQTTGCAQLSLRGTFTEVDSAFADLSGFAATDLRHVRLVDILPLSRRVEALGFVEGVLVSGSPAAFSTVLMRKSGGETTVRVGLAPLMDDHNIAGASVVVSSA